MAMTNEVFGAILKGAQVEYGDGRGDWIPVFKHIDIHDMRHLDWRIAPKPVEQRDFAGALKWLLEGNCLTACVSTLTGLPMESLPEFCRDSDWYSRLREWAMDNGYGVNYWRNDMGSMLADNQNLILLLRLDGTDELHAVIARTEATPIGPTEDGSGTAYQWKSYVTFDPNLFGTPEVQDVDGYLVLTPLHDEIGEQARERGSR